MITIKKVAETGYLEMSREGALASMIYFHPKHHSHRQIAKEQFIRHTKMEYADHAR